MAGTGDTRVLHISPALDAIFEALVAGEFEDVEVEAAVVLGVEDTLVPEGVFAARELVADADGTHVASLPRPP